MAVQTKANQIYLRQINRTKHKELSEYVDKTQWQYDTALKRAAKIKKNNTAT